MRTAKHMYHLRQAAILGFLAVAFAAPRAEGEDPVIAGYRARQEDLVQRSNVILAAADQAGRELTTEERNEIRDNTAEVERLDGEITLREQVARQDAALRTPQPRQAPANSGEPLAQPQATPQAAGRRQAAQEGGAVVVQTTHLNTAAHRAARTGNGGFNTFGHFAQAVRAAAGNPGNMDNRLMAALTTYGNEGSGADGGFAVPPDYRDRIVSLSMFSEESLFNRTDNSPTNSNSVTLPKDETTPWGTSGVRVYSRAEAQQMSQSKPLLGDMTVKLHELYAFVPVTDELLDDAPQLENHLTTKAGEAIQFKLNDWILNGTGVGQMLGILNSPSLVTVAAEGSQVADTIHGDNILKMWARMPAAVRSRAVWLINQDAEPQVMKLGSVVTTAAGTAVGGIPMYMPPGGFSAAPYGTLLGRPVITTEACPQLGDVGDIVFSFLGGYFAPYKGNVKSDVSIHLFFDQGVTAFRWTLRVGGQPWLSAPIARKNGSNTLSHNVALAAR